jgi:alanine racemase
MPVATVQISRSALLHNLESLRSLQPGAKVMAVVKGNAYGHGQELVTSVLEPHVDMFYVDDLEELRLLRRTSHKPTLVGGYVPTEDLEEAMELLGTLVLYDQERLKPLEQAAARAGRAAEVHLKIDALLGRQGLLPEELPDFCGELKKFPGIQVTGAYAHFANIEDTTDPVHAQSQVDVFEGALASLRHQGYEQIARHISSTSGLMVYEKGSKANDYVRLGIGLYGLYPSEALARPFESLALRPVMRWVTKLAQVKELPAQHPVGYGLTYITSRPTRVGIVPQGYSDGYDRGLSSAADVLVNGVRCAVIGRVAMNMFMVDLTQAPEARPEDEVVLLGSQGGNRISAEEMARRIGTINYEVVTRVSPLLRREVVE